MSIDNSAVPTRQRVIDATIALFAEKGYQTRVQDIAKAAGFTAGAIYVHFPSRLDLIEEAVLTAATNALDAKPVANLTAADRALILEAIAITARNPRPGPFLDIISAHPTATLGTLVSDAIETALDPTP